MAARTRPRTRKRRRIGVINNKGGSLKTTTALNLGAKLAARKKRVRLNDVDPQRGSSTIWLPPVDDVGEGILHVFQKTRSIDEVTSRTSVDGLYLVPSYPSLSAVLENPPADMDYRLADALDESEADLEFDILDCPPTKDRLAVSALCAVEDVVISMNPSELDLTGVGELLELFEMLKRRMNPDLRLAALVVGRITPNAGYDLGLVEDLEKQYPDVPVIAVPNSVRMREATTAKQPITTFDPGGSADRAFDKLADIWAKEPTK